MGDTARYTNALGELFCTARVAVTYADDGDTVQIAKVPAGAQIQFITYEVYAQFNNPGGTDLINVGDDSSATRFKSSLDVDVTAGTKGMIDCGGYQYAAEDTIDVDYAGTSATVGTCYFQVFYTLNANQKAAYGLSA